MRPLALIALGAIVLWLASGVEPGDIALFTGYELAFVLAPGWLLLRLLAPGVRSRAWQLALGWPLGLFLELAAFCATAALGVRDLYSFYPVVVAAIAAGVLAARRRRARPAPEGADEEPATKAASSGLLPTEAWALAALCLIAFGYLGLTAIVQAPLPGTAPSVFYNPDTMFHVAVAAEALHHWPLEIPQVAGGALHYHYFAHLHVAATTQVTGIDLPVVFTRLYLLPLVAMLLLQAAMAGRAITGLAWAGPVTAALFLLVRALDLTIAEVAPFLDGNSFWIWNSASYAFGLTFLLPLMVLLAGLVEPAVWDRLGIGRRPAWTMAGILLVCAAGGKAVVLPILVGGLGIFLAWTWVRGRGIERSAAAALVACVAVLVGSVAVLYSGGGSPLAPAIGQVYEIMPALRSLETLVGDSAPAQIGFWGSGALITTALLLGPPLLGLAWVLGRGRPPLRPGQSLLLSIFLAGVLVLLLIHDDRGNENYFAGYAIVAALPVAAEGLVRGLGPWFRSREDLKKVIVASCLWLGFCTALALIGWGLDLDDHPARSYALVYGGFALGSVLLFLWARSALPWAGRIALLSMAVLVPASADLVLDSAPETVRDLRDGVPLYNSQAGVGITPGSYEGLEWIRENTDEDSILAGSFPSEPAASGVAPIRFDLAALAERRTFYEGWAYAAGAGKFDSSLVFAGRKQPYPERHELSERLFTEGDPAALDKMVEKYGITHLVIDPERGEVNDRVSGLGRTVFSNGAIEVIEVSP